MNRHINKLFSIIISSILISCNSDVAENQTDATLANTPVATAPPFDEQLAYSFIEQQVLIGPRYPGSEGQKKMRRLSPKNIGFFCRYDIYAVG